MRKGTSTSPRNGCKRRKGCTQSGNNGNGITMPANTVTTAGMIRSMPAAEMVHSKEICDSIVMAVDNAAAPTRDTLKSTPDTQDGGAPKAPSARQRRGSTSNARTPRGVGRESGGGGGMARGWAYQKA